MLFCILYGPVRACNYIVHLAIWYVVLVFHQYDVCKNYVGGYGGQSERGLCDFRELCPVIFLVVGERPSVLC